MKVLVSDLGGVVYSFDENLDPGGHQKNFDVAMTKLGLADADTKGQLEGEWQAVEKGWLKIFPTKSGVENLIENAKNWG